MPRIITLWYFITYAYTFFPYNMFITRGFMNCKIIPNNNIWSDGFWNVLYSTLGNSEHKFTATFNLHKYIIIRRSCDSGTNIYIEKVNVFQCYHERWRLIINVHTFDFSFKGEEIKKEIFIINDFVYFKLKLFFLVINLIIQN